MNNEQMGVKPIMISNAEFLREVFAGAPPAMYAHTCWFAGDPNGAQAGVWRGLSWNIARGAPSGLDQVQTHTLNTYFSVAGLAPGPDGNVSRKKANFDRMVVLVVDDAEIATIDGEPSYVIETSPGRHQVGILLQLSDPDCANVDLVTELVTTMAESGLISGDKSGNNVVRYVRLPRGCNGKPRDTGPFAHHVTLWQPGIRYSLREAAAMVGINIDDLRRNLLHRRELARSSGVTEYQAARDLGLAGSQSGKLPGLTSNVLRGEGLHDSINELAASLVATGMAGGAVVNLLKALMANAACPHDHRWEARFRDIPRAVSTAQEKFKRVGAGTAVANARFEVDSATGTVKKKSMFIRLDELLAQGLRAPRWVIEGMMEQDTMSLLFGPPGEGKSFLTIDWAMCVVTGTPWHGHRVQQGPVVYLAGEGHQGFSRRVQAWGRLNNVSTEGRELYLSRKSHTIISEEGALAIVDDIEGMLPAGVKPALVVIDTFARAAVGLDENSAKDISLFVNIVDIYIRDRWKAPVLTVHHSGHEGGRARGSTALKGALDSEYSVETMAGLVRKLSCTKMKEAEKPAPIHFILQNVHLGDVIGQWGDQVAVNAAAVRIAGDAQIPVGDAKGRGPKPLLDCTCANLVDYLMREQKWPGVTAIATFFGCGRSKAMALLKRAEDEGYIEPSGRGRHKQYTVTAKGARQNISGRGVSLP
jgi:hypothetical protein